MRSPKLLLLTILTLQAVAVTAAGTPKPRLVVQIVVSQMRYDYLERFGNNFSKKGFNRFQSEGATFTDGRYDYMLTGTEASLATLTTGAMPSTHGIIGNHWVDFIEGRKVELVADAAACGLFCDSGIGCNSPVNLVVPTLGDRLLEESPKSKVVTIAASSCSAVVMGGFTQDVFWCDQSRGMWITSDHYMKQLPEWIIKYNDTRPANQYLEAEWTPFKHREQYVNTRYSAIKIIEDTRFVKVNALSGLFKRDVISKDYPKIYSTPFGNSLVKDFARQAVIYKDLGQDEHTDLLNVCFDATRNAGEFFGPESIEVEDMFYRLDEDIAEFIDFIYSQVKKEDVVIVLTSDHGASDSYDRAQKPRDRFNIPQFRVILSSFMNAQYGNGDWVLGYSDRQIYLNRNLIYQKKLILAEVQNRVAAFALQFRGISHAVTSTALSNSSFAWGYGRMMQNSFYPRRSGDVVVNLMPGWIEEREYTRSLSGSMYDYDTHVPLMMLGAVHGVMRIRSPVDMTMVAPTLARLMQINRPVAATGAEITELTEQLDY